MDTLKKYHAFMPIISLKGIYVLALWSTGLLFQRLCATVNSHIFKKGGGVFLHFPMSPLSKSPDVPHMVMC